MRDKKVTRDRCRKGVEGERLEERGGRREEGGTEWEERDGRRGWEKRGENRNG